MCQPLDPIDFETRAWIPLSGWPLSYSELLPYYRRAQDFCRAGSFGYSEPAWRQTATDAPVLRPDTMAFRFWQLTDRPQFAAIYGAELERDDNPRIFLHANAVEIVATPSGDRIKEIRLRALDGREAVLRADVFVIACGALESARLLLMSPGIDNRGIGNAHDMVGRCFMAHTRFWIDGFAPKQSGAAYRFLNERQIGDARVLAGLGPSAAAQRRHKLVNASLRFTPSYSDAYRAFMRIGRESDSHAWPPHLLDDLMTMVADFDDSLRDLYAHLIDGEEPIESFSLLFLLDDPPISDNRARLTSERDALGMPKLAVDWRPPAVVKDTLRRFIGMVDAETRRLGLGTAPSPDWLHQDDDSWLAAATGGIGHHMGTLRMADDPRDGVTDRYGRVHGFTNLYAAGAAIFPTGGCANPTLTLIALTFRLADRLKSELR